MFKISFSSLGNPNMRLERFADLLGRCGYDGIALRGRPDHHVHWQDDAERRAEVRSTLADNGLGVSSIATYVFVATRDSGGPERSDTRNEQENIEEVLRWMDLAEDLGAETVRVFGGALTPGETHEDAIPRIARIMDAAAAEHPDVNVAIELHDDAPPELQGGVGHRRDRVGRGEPGGRGGRPGAGAHRLRAGDGQVPTDGRQAVSLPAGRGRYAGAAGHGGAGVGRMERLPGRRVRGPLQRIHARGRGSHPADLDAEYEAHYNEYMPEVEVAIPQTIMKLRQWMKTMSSDE